MHQAQRRANTYHRPKKQVLGYQPPVPPAWKAANNPNHNNEPGSKIMLSSLPMDVQETDVEDLFKKTVGPLKDCFLVYNSQGKSKGMAVVSFQRPGDAAVACQKYDGKIVDGRRPIRVEIVSKAGAEAPAKPPPGPSLMQRLGEFAQPNNNNNNKAPAKTTNNRLPTGNIVANGNARNGNNHRRGSPPPRRPRVKKGAKRVQKRPVTQEQLDKEMDDYRANSTGTAAKGEPR